MVTHTSPLQFQRDGAAGGGASSEVAAVGQIALSVASWMCKQPERKLPPDSTSDTCTIVTPVLFNPMYGCDCVLILIFQNHCYHCVILALNVIFHSGSHHSNSRINEGDRGS